MNASYFLLVTFSDAISLSRIVIVETFSCVMVIVEKSLNVYFLLAMVRKGEDIVVYSPNIWL